MKRKKAPEPKERKTQFGIKNYDPDCPQCQMIKAKALGLIE